MKNVHVLLVISTIMIYSCKEDEVIEIFPKEASVAVTVAGLPPLTEPGTHYQLWAAFTIFSTDSPLHDSTYVSLGEFNIAADGHLVGVDTPTPEFTIPSGQNAQLLDKAIITVQTEEASGITRVLHEEPGGAILGGLFAGSSSEAVANLDMSFKDAFGSDFSTVTGKYTITAPTSVVADSNSGVWFFESPASASLRNLATLKDEWTYEGWVIDKTDSLQWRYYSTGKFLRADSADFDGAGRNSGPGPGLNFPGQDFIVADSALPSRPNLLDGNHGFMVTIEPVPDDSPEPFYLTLLSTDSTAVPGMSGQSFDMVNVASHHTATARITVER